MPNLTFNIADLVGVDFDTRRTKVWIEANADPIIDTAGKVMHFGDARVTLADDGTGAFTGLLATNATGIKPASGLLYRAWVDYATRSGGRKQWSSGWFALTADADLADLATVDVTVVDTVLIASMSQMVLDAQAARDAAQAVGTTNDTVIAAQINSPTSATKAALSASIAQQATPRWKAGTAYTSGDTVLAPDGSLVKANTTFTSGTTYNAANWTTVAATPGTQARTELDARYPKRSVYKPWGLRRWSAAFTDTKRGAAGTRINLIGDSTVYGIGADGTQSTTDSTGAGFTSADRLRKLLNTSLGLSLDAGVFVLPSDTRVTKTGAFASTTTGPFGVTSYSMQSSGLSMVFPTYNCTTIQILTVWIPGTSGQFTYSVDGGADQTAAAGSGTGPNTIQSTFINGLSSGSHQVNIKSPASGRVYVIGVVYTQSNGITVGRIGKPGATTLDLIQGVAGSITAAGKFRRQLMLTTFNAWDADLTVIKLGINDLGLPGAGQAQAIQPADYKANLKYLCQWVTNPAAAADAEYATANADAMAPRSTIGKCVLLVVGPRAATVGTTSEDSYWAVAKQVCDEMDHVAMINLADWYGTFTEAHDTSMALQLSGSVHSTPRGYSWDADIIHSAITSPQVIGF